MVAALHLDRQAEGKPGLFPGKCVELKRAGESEPQAGAADEPERRLIAIPDFRFAVFDFARRFPVSRFLGSRFSAVNTTMAMSVRSRRAAGDTTWSRAPAQGAPRDAAEIHHDKGEIGVADEDVGGVHRLVQGAAADPDEVLQQRRIVRLGIKGVEGVHERHAHPPLPRRRQQTGDQQLAAGARRQRHDFGDASEGQSPSPASSIAATRWQVAAGRGAAWGKRSASRSRSAARLSGEPRMTGASPHISQCADAATKPYAFYRR